VVGNIFHAGVFSPEIAGLLVFVHLVISKTYYTCPIIVLELCFFTSLLGLVAQRIAFSFFHYLFFLAIIIFSILGHLLPSFPVISLCAFGVPSILCIPLFFPRPPTTTLLLVLNIGVKGHFTYR